MTFSSSVMLRHTNAFYFCLLILYAIILAKLLVLIIHLYLLLGFTMQIILFLPVQSLFHFFFFYYCVVQTSNWILNKGILYWCNFFSGYNHKKSIWIPNFLFLSLCFILHIFCNWYALHSFFLLFSSENKSKPLEKIKEQDGEYLRTFQLDWLTNC